MVLETQALSQVFLIYSWFVLSAVLGFVLLIARFYQHFSGERTFYRWYALPVILYGIATLRFASIDRVGGDPLGDLLAGAAGVSLIMLIGRLYRQMTRGRRPI
jgi:hypothetical protein